MWSPLLQHGERRQFLQPSVTTKNTR
jgi:hypothetical protein